MVAKEYLGRSRLFRRLKNGAHGELVERYAVCLVNEGLARHGTWRCLNLVGDLLSWIAGSRSKLPTSMNAWSIATSGTEAISSPSSVVTGRR
jgi:hypothetical protein